jgi:hypothetical protein
LAPSRRMPALGSNVQEDMQRGLSCWKRLLVVAAWHSPEDGVVLEQQRVSAHQALLWVQVGAAGVAMGLLHGWTAGVRGGGQRSMARNTQEAHMPP